MRPVDRPRKRRIVRSAGPRSLLEPLFDREYEALMTDKTPTVTREPASIELRWCPVCRQYMTAGSKEAGKCVVCNTTRPASGPESLDR